MIIDTKFLRLLIQSFTGKMGELLISMESTIPSFQPQLSWTSSCQKFKFWINHKYSYENKFQQLKGKKERKEEILKKIWIDCHKTGNKRWKKIKWKTWMMVKIKVHKFFSHTKFMLSKWKIFAWMQKNILAFSVYTYKMNNNVPM